MKITDSPGAMVVTPFSGTAAANDSELSSIFQPVMSTAAPPMLVTSNQSAPTGLLPLDHGATSEMINLPTGPTVPGEPISLASFAAANAPLIADRAQLRDRGVVQPGRVVEGRERRAGGRRAEGHAGLERAAAVEEVDGVATGAQADAATRSSCRSGGPPAGSRRTRSLRNAAACGRARSPVSMKITDSPGAMLVTPFSATATAERVRVVVHLPAGEVDGAGAGVRHLEPVGARPGCCRWTTARPRR